MKKYVILMMSFVCAFMLIGCSPTKTFTIEHAKSINIMSGTTGQTKSFDEDKVIAHITDNITSLKFKKQESSQDSTGWGYKVSWYDEDKKNIESIVIMDEHTIDYDGYFYSTDDSHGINIKYLEQILDSMK